MKTGKGVGRGFCLIIALVAGVCLAGSAASHAAEPADKSDDAASAALVTKVAQRTGLQFTVPFPKDFDIDVRYRRPLAARRASGFDLWVSSPLIERDEEYCSVILC